MRKFKTGICVAVRGSSSQTISLHPHSTACKAGSEQKACIQTAKESFCSSDAYIQTH